MNEKSNIICEADMRCNWTDFKRTATIIYYIVAAFLFYKLGPAKADDNIYSKIKYLWGIDYYEEGLFGSTSFYFGKFLLALVITIIVIILPVVLFKVIRAMVMQSSLELNSTSLIGSKRTFNSRYNFEIPIESIHTIACKKSIIGKFVYQSTMYIDSSRGYHVLYGVNNAEIFINSVMKEIEKTKKNSKELKINDSDADTISKINLIKQMLDNQLITQEEFEQKKKDILSKM